MTAETNPEVSVEPTQVPVIQADRDAVQAFHRVRLDKLMAAIKDEKAGARFGDDEGDAGDLVQAFARHRLASQPSGPATQPSATVEAITAAITDADASFSYTYRLTGLNDGVEEHTLFMPGFDPVTFADRQDGYEVIAERRNRLRAEAILTTLHTPPPVATATVDAGESDDEAITAAAKRMVAAQGMDWAELDGGDIGYWESLAAEVLGGDA